MVNHMHEVQHHWFVSSAEGSGSESGSQVSCGSLNADNYCWKSQVRHRRKLLMRSVHDDNNKNTSSSTACWSNFRAGIACKVAMR